MEPTGTPLPERRSRPRGAESTARDPAGARPSRGTLSGGTGSFVALTFGVSWAAWGIGALIGRPGDDPLMTALFLIGGSGPLLAVLALRLAGRRGSRVAQGRRVGLWGPVALGLGALPAVAAAFLPVLGGVSAGGATAVAPAVASAGGPLLFLASTAVAGPLSEEFGWRGYAQPRLLQTLSPVQTSATLGAMWGVWHLPLFAFPGTWQESVGLLSPEGAMIVLGAVPLSAIAWFVSARLRGGVPAAVLAHTAANGSLALFPPESTTAVVVFGIVLVATAVVVLWIGRHDAGHHGRDGLPGLTRAS